MATLNEITFNIAHAAGRQDDDVYLERLKFQVGYYRAIILRREFTRNPFISDHFMQTIGCVDMEFVDASSCCGTDVGCNVFRSTVRIPRPIRVKDYRPFVFVGTIDGKLSFTAMDGNELEFVKYNKYSSKAPRYYYDGGFLYLLGKAPDKLRVKGVFEDPAALAEVIDCNTNEACFGPDSEYPMSEDLVQAVTEAIMNAEARRENPENDSEEVTIDG